MIIYTNRYDGELYLEFWGSSTKHPDCRFCMQDDIQKGLFTKSEWIDDEDYAVFQWVAYRLTTMSFHTFYYMRDIMKMMEDVFGDNYFM